MRAAGQRRGRLAQRNHPSHAAADEIELRYRRSVPQRDEAALAILSYHRCVRQRCRNLLERGEIEAAHDLAVGRVQEKRFVGMIAGDQQAFLATALSDAETRRISDVAELGAAFFSVRDFQSRREWEETLRSHTAIVESVDGDSVSGASLLLAKRIGERGHRRKQMFAVQAEGKTQEIRLLGVASETIVGKVLQLVGRQIQYGERLLFAGSVGAIAAVKENDEAAVGRNRGCSGEVIDPAGIAGNSAEEFAVWKLRERACILRKQRLQEESRCESPAAKAGAKGHFHSGSICESSD